MTDTGSRNGIPVRTLGKTGVDVTVICIGGWHIGQAASPEEGVRIIQTAIDEGINFLDNAWCYNKGESERIMGRALRNGYRDKIFLMTKNHGRNADMFRQQLDESLTRLQTDRIDLLQFHEIIHDGEPDSIFAAEGAIGAAVEARNAGKIRFIGFTGHRWPHLLLQMLEKNFAWDTIQFPVNLLDAYYRSFTRDVMPEALRRGVAVLGMKSLAGGKILQTQITPREAILYALSHPIVSLVCGMDSIEVLQQNLDIARSFRNLEEAEKRDLLGRVEPYAHDGHLEFYKTA